MPSVAAVSAQTSSQTLDRDAYVVKPGDNLSDIARQHGVSLDALIRANPQISNPNLIRPGEEVTIPTGAQASATAPRTTPSSGATPSPGSVSGSGSTGASWPS